MKTRVALTAIIALAVFGAIFGYKFLTIRKAMAAQAKMVRPPITVSAALAREEAWPNTISAVGALASFQGVTVRSELEGTVREVLFESGAVVAAGQPLVQIDISVESAQLAGLEAQARLADINLGRAKDLRSKSTNSQADLDIAEATAQQAHAAAAQLRATIAKKRIIAPFPGRLGIAKVYPGQYLSKADAIVELETLDPIYADFSLPQQELARVTLGQPVRVTLDAWPDRPVEGKIAAISPRVTDATHSLRVRATLANPQETLRPGMFANIEVLLPASDHTVVLPAAAIVYSPYGNTVFVIENNVVHPRFVQVGAQRGDLIAVTSGLKAGEQVVTAGQIKLRNGATVRVDNSAAPDANPAPKPQES
jgi:membrane fusion protein (multidrug efflux system)